MRRLADSTFSYTLLAPDTATHVVVSDGAGAEIDTYPVNDGAVTIPQSDIYRYDVYTLLWDTMQTERVERVQRRYFDDGELRKFMGTSLSVDVDTESLIDTVEGVFDRAASRSFCLKGKREKFLPHGRRIFTLTETDVYTVYSVQIDSKDTEWKLYDGQLIVDTSGAKEVAVHYAYGLVDAPMQLKRCALLYASSIAGGDSSGLSPRATGEQNDYGYIRYSVAGRDGATGIPEVDAFLGFDKSKGGYGYLPMVIV